MVGKGNKLIINLNKNLLIKNEFSHLSYKFLNKINFILIKYNFLVLFFDNFIYMNYFIKILEKIKKKDIYKGKGLIDIFKKIKFKVGKKSDYIR